MQEVLKQENTIDTNVLNEVTQGWDVSTFEEMVTYVLPADEDPGTHLIHQIKLQISPDNINWFDMLDDNGNIIEIVGIGSAEKHDIRPYNFMRGIVSVVEGSLSNSCLCFSASREVNKVI